MKKYANPASFGEDQVRFCLFGGDDLVPNRLRKRNIDQTVAEERAQFPLSQPELHPAKSMMSARDLMPPRSQRRGYGAVLLGSTRYPPPMTCSLDGHGQGMVRRQRGYLQCCRTRFGAVACRV